MQVHIELLDANQEHVIEEWTFAPQTQGVVRMGRARENDVVISDRYVSRLHAELRFHDGFWEIVNLGQHGILRQGQRIADTCRLKEHDELELGVSGIVLRFSLLAETGGGPSFAESLTTLVFTSNSPSRIAIDHGDVSRQVGEIVESPYFRELKAIRHKRDDEQTAGR
jgi:pSer/pThr/pTyr-binding forkhead associated (FHA) protein